MTSTALRLVHFRLSLHAARLRGMALPYPAIGAHLGVTPGYARQLASFGDRLLRHHPRAVAAADGREEEHPA
jgi:hypothetical protein